MNFEQQKMQSENKYLLTKNDIKLLCAIAGKVDVNEITALKRKKQL